ncbi:MAG: hydrogenase maturation protease [Candidatus Edwardsbacteria bacterium]|nr:hydrogenase maturation protease [Candidatus Edwardsbacteria bacterium]MBU1576086.1 hydrogenase maturation protease [Candidatus Edwardsbacteria bacterium]MBU2462742.1 hydrogenase maturation protease [Candidatus Edwardsbacteria bacterium]MBU2593223.1 hydrogenase maturation protease [Candidatus Edwardsbacteria bacterium]
MPDLFEYLGSLNGDSLIIGVGNVLRGDDGFGPELVKNLSGRTKVNLLDGGETPEDLLSQIVQLAPARLVIADAVALGGMPGDAALLESDQLGKRIAVSTHNLSLLMFIKYLKEKLPELDIKILGVQPRGIEFGKGLSTEVRTTIDNLAGIIAGR